MNVGELSRVNILLSSQYITSPFLLEIILEFLPDCSTNIKKINSVVPRNDLSVIS